MAPDTNPADLISARWTFKSLWGFHGAGAVAADSQNVTLTFNDAGVVLSGCNAATARLSDGHITFRQEWINGLILTTPPSCGTLGVDQENFAFSVLSGTVTWSISNGELTIIHPGTGTLTLK